MPTIEDTIKVLEKLFKLLATNSESIYSVPSNTVVSDALLDAQTIMNRAVREQLKWLLREPPHLRNYTDALKDFHEKGSYEKSVFIMTKFPEGDSVEDAELRNVIDVVRQSILDAGFVCRIASDKPGYDKTGWGNVEVHLLGCSRGIAIVEDHYRSELNPNVALEWGWMRAMGKDVLFLRENSFDKVRADITGFIYDQFEWKNPKHNIPDIVKKWLV